MNKDERWQDERQENLNGKGVEVSSTKHDSQDAFNIYRHPDSYPKKMSRTNEIEDRRKGQ